MEKSRELNLCTSNEIVCSCKRVPFAMPRATRNIPIPAQTIALNQCSTIFIGIISAMCVQYGMPLPMRWYNALHITRAVYRWRKARGRVCNRSNTTLTNTLRHMGTMCTTMVFVATTLLSGALRALTRSASAPRGKVLTLTPTITG